VSEREGMASAVLLSLDEVAKLVSGTVIGDPGHRVRGVAPLETAGELDLALLADRRYLGAALGTRSRALLVSAALADTVGEDRSAVVVQDAHAALATLLNHFHPLPEHNPAVHSTAALGLGVRLGRGVTVGAYAVLGDGSVLSDGVQVGSHVVVGAGSEIGEGSILHPHVVLYPRTSVGRRVIVHAGARLGSDGFGYVLGETGFRKVPQVGRCIIEDDVEIGANTCIDRGSIGDTVIGRGSKLDNLVHVAHNVHLGPSCALAAQVGIAGSTRIGAGVVFGGQSGAGGHLEIGEGARVSAKAGILTNVEARATVAGFPARDVRSYMKGAALMLRLPELHKRVRAIERKLGFAASESPAERDTEPQ